MLWQVLVLTRDVPRLVIGGPGCALTSWVLILWLGDRYMGWIAQRRWW